MNLLALLIFLSGLFLITIGYYRQLLQKGQVTKSSKELTEEQLREYRDTFVMDSLNVTNTFEPIFLPTDIWFRRGVNELNNLFEDTIQEASLKKEINKDYFECSDHDMFKKKPSKSREILTVNSKEKTLQIKPNINQSSVYRVGSIQSQKGDLETNNFGVACAMTCKKKKNEKGESEKFYNFTDFKNAWNQTKKAPNQTGSILMDFQKATQSNDPSCICTDDNSKEKAFQCGPDGIRKRSGHDLRKKTSQGIAKQSIGTIDIYDNDIIRNAFKKIFTYDFIRKNTKIKEYYTKPRSFLNPSRNKNIYNFKFSSLSSEFQNQVLDILELDEQLQQAANTPPTTKAPQPVALR